MPGNKPATQTHGKYVEIDGTSVNLDHLCLAKGIRLFHPGESGEWRASELSAVLPSACSARYLRLLLDLAARWDTTVRLPDCRTVLRAELDGPR